MRTATHAPSRSFGIGALVNTISGVLQTVSYDARLHWVASDVLDVGRSGNARRMKHLTRLESVANATPVFSVSSHANTFFHG
jgi:hypothetical protein